MKILERLNECIESILSFLCASLLAVFTFLVSLQIIARGLLNYSMAWSIEASLMAFIWSIFLGAPIALRRRLHFNIEIFSKNWVKCNLILDIFGDLCCYLVLYVMVVYGVEFARMGISQYFSYLYISQSFLMVAIFVSGALMVPICTENLFRDIVSFRNALSYRPKKVED